MFFEGAVASRGQVLRASSAGSARGAPWECAVGQRGHWTWALEKLFFRWRGMGTALPGEGMVRARASAGAINDNSGKESGAGDSGR